MVDSIRTPGRTREPRTIRAPSVSALTGCGRSAANIPYFLYFFKNINSSIWNWAEYGTTTFGMLFGEASYYPPMLAFIVLLTVFIWASNRWMRRFVMPAPSSRFLARLPAVALGLACIGLCLFGIRGRRGYNPIKVSAAYYCQDPFLNQLGVNPAFNLHPFGFESHRSY